jgi:cysteinyl-tRNA synthetase
MPPPTPPDDVRRLLDERTEARAAKDWTRADTLRDDLAALGWEVQDAAGGSTVRPILPVADPGGLAAPATVMASLQLVAEDHPGDLVRMLHGLTAYPPAVDWELIIVANAPSFDLEELLQEVDSPIAPIIVRTDGRLGWADARTMGMTRSSGEITILLDTSLEPIGDAVAPLLAAFDDPTVGLAGGWGVTSADAREFDDAPPGEVDAIEGYCLAVRREALRAVGGFDRRFRFYRNADLDFSFAVRDAGWRAIRTEPLPFERHEHRGWTSLPDAERDRVSRRNFYRFLDRWRDRPDLLLGRPDR